MIFDIFERVQITEFMRLFPGFEEKSVYFSKKTPPPHIFYLHIKEFGWLGGWVTGEIGIKANPNKPELELKLALSLAIRLC